MSGVFRRVSRLCLSKVNLFNQWLCYSSHDAPYKLRIAMPWDNDNIMKMMYEAYIQHEPSIANIGLGNQSVPAVEQSMKESLKDGKTIIAVDETNCIVGAAINSALSPFHVQKMIQHADCCECGPAKDLLKFYAFLHTQTNVWAKYKVPVLFECGYVSVHPDHGGHGIAKALMAESWNLARDCGYQVFRVDCTSLYTAKIAEKLGWECIYRIPFRRYIECGEPVFTKIQEPHTEVKVFIDRPFHDKCEKANEIECEC